MKFKAFIFDLDGTLVNSIQDLADSVNFSLSKQGFDTLSIDEVRQRIGYGIDKLVISSLPKKYQNNNKIIGRSLEMMAQHYSISWKKHTVLYPKIDQLLDILMMKNISISILTNKPEPFLLEMVEFLMKKWDFDSIIGGSLKFPLKPNPQSTTEIIKSLNCDPSEVAFIGDGDTDIKTAIGAGITPIAVTWGFRTVEELQKAGAEIFIDEPLELLNFI